MEFEVEDYIWQIALIKMRFERGRISTEALGKIAPELLIGKANVFPLAQNDKSIARISDTVSGYLRGGIIVEIHDTAFDEFYLSCSKSSGGHLKFNFDMRNVYDVVRNSSELLLHWLSLVEENKEEKALVIIEGMKVHRFIWRFMTGNSMSEKLEVHHLNQVKTDNRSCNLQGLTKQNHDKLIHDIWKRVAALTDELLAKETFL